MGLTGSSATYARLKDLMFGPILEPDAEPPLVAEFLRESELVLDISFRYFFDDNYGATTTFAKMLWFLHKKYCPQVA